MNFNAATSAWAFLRCPNLLQSSQLVHSHRPETSWSTATTPPPCRTSLTSQTRRLLSYNNNSNNNNNKAFYLSANTRSIHPRPSKLLVRLLSSLYRRNSCGPASSALYRQQPPDLTQQPTLHHPKLLSQRPAAYLLLPRHLRSCKTILTCSRPPPRSA